MFEKDLFGGAVQPQKQGGVLSDTWEYPPFSVLNARDGWWQERKRQWLSLGIKSELGRGGGQPGTSTQTGLTWRTDDAIGSNMNGYRERKNG